jgi:cytochrome c-type biogenesis protein CcmH/NrfF
MSNTRIHKRRGLAVLLAAFVLLLPIAVAIGSAIGDDARLDTLGAQLMCICGCNQVLIGCNHIDCKSSVPMLNELRGHIAKGETDSQILASFVDKYTIKVLSAPPKSGFHWAAWITPFAALFGGAFVAVYFVRKWKSEAPAPAAAPDSAADTAHRSEYQRRVEEELTKYTPED